MLATNKIPFTSFCIVEKEEIPETDFLKPIDP